MFDETASKSNNNLLIFRTEPLEIMQQTGKPYKTGKGTIPPKWAPLTFSLTGNLSQCLAGAQRHQVPIIHVNSFTQLSEIPMGVCSTISILQASKLKLGVLPRSHTAGTWKSQHLRPSIVMHCLTRFHVTTVHIHNGGPLSL